METKETVTRKKTLPSILRSLPERVAELVERFFYTIGYKIAERPVSWLISCTFVVLLCLSGLIFFRQEKNPLKLWVPPDSRFVRDTEWLLSHFHEGLRTETVVLIADDVFQPEALLKLNEITREIIETKSPEQVSWFDVCYKVPVISGVSPPPRRRRTPTNEDQPANKRKKTRERRKKRDTMPDFFELEPGENVTETFEPSVHADPRLYCGIVNSLPRVCLTQTVLDVFDYDDDTIRSMSRDQIIERLTETRLSPSLGHPIDFLGMIGGIERDPNGTVQSGTAVKSMFVTHIDFSRVDSRNFGNDAGTADWATDDILQWETAFLDKLRSVEARLDEERKAGNGSVRIVYEAGRSFGDISSATIFQDVDKVLIGACLMFAYVLAILSRWNWVELRFCLTGAGLLCIAGAFIIAVGLCSILGIPYGPVHTSLPFMLLALGVDDIFVMMASWRQVHADRSNRDKPLKERIGLMLGHAGSAICITSLTDVIAFVIGASTILPSLQSFCIYAAVGVLVTFLLQLTFFVGFFTLDCRRMDSKRNGVLPCLTHQDYSPRVSKGSSVSTRAIDTLYDKVVLTRPGRTVILVLTIVLTCFGILGSTQLQQWFDPHWFLPKDSYLAKYRAARNDYFPENGYDAFVLMGRFNYTAEFRRILRLTDRMQNLSTVQTIQPWPVHFNQFVQTYYQKDMSRTVLPEDDFHLYLSRFLYSRAGGKYQGNFQFNGNLTCGSRTPAISLSTIDFVFKRFTGPDQWVPAMDESLEVLDGAAIQGYATVWCKYFSLWVTDKLIAQEVLRNLLLALICVMGMTSLLIMEPQTCFWILLCVLLTLLDVCGFMHFWGLTIDVVTCIGLELSIGLSVDYAAHVAHGFLTADAQDGPGNRRRRVQTAVRHIGAAVAYGAGSTSIALSMLVFSDAYVFQTFFRIFFLVIVFGLWHGLMLLPVVLSLIGPKSVKPTTTGHDGAKDETEECKPLNRYEKGESETQRSRLEGLNIDAREWEKVDYKDRLGEKPADSKVMSSDKTSLDGRRLDGGESWDRSDENSVGNKVRSEGRNLNTGDWATMGGRNRSVDKVRSEGVNLNAGSWPGLWGRNRSVDKARSEELRSGARDWDRSGDKVRSEEINLTGETGDRLESWRGSTVKDRSKEDTKTEGSMDQ